MLRKLWMAILAAIGVIPVVSCGGNNGWTAPDLSAVKPAPPVWGSTIVDGEVAGHPCHLFEPRCRSIAELADHAHRWAERDFLVPGDRRLTFAETLEEVAVA